LKLFSLDLRAMDEQEWTPQVFANKVILQFVQHLMAGGMVVEPEDYLVIRTVFRSVGGSWSRLADGDVVMLELLQKIISAWGNMPDRKLEDETLV
jgi:hypothetical protein